MLKGVRRYQGRGDIIMLSMAFSQEDALTPSTQYSKS